MSFSAYEIVALTTAPGDRFVLLSYPGLEANGTIVIAPLLRPEEIAIVDTLHPIIQTTHGPRVLVVERLAAVLLELTTPTGENLMQHEYAIHRALSRLFFGN